MPSRRFAPGGNWPASCRYLCTASRPVNTTPEINTSSRTFSARILDLVKGKFNRVMACISYKTKTKVQPAGTCGTRTRRWGIFVALRPSGNNLAHMRGSSDRASITQMLSGLRWVARHRSSISCVVILLTLSALAHLPVLADGCFVFRWDKKIDINEPTQKAIILHDTGREDVLLQVKYEGPLEEFGWLIPVPSVPKVEKGSMEAFYELSQLTQSHFGTLYTAGTLSTRGSHDESVKVIEVKT